MQFDLVVPALWSTKNSLSLLQDVDQERVRRDLVTFFGPRADRYLAIYEDMRDSKMVTSSWTWSWAVFFGGFVWFFYRKMYLSGALLVVLPIAASLVLGGAGAGGAAVALAIFAKGYYVQSALRRVYKADALGLTAAERDDYLRRAGGVSATAGVLAGILYAALLALAILSIFARLK